MIRRAALLILAAVAACGGTSAAPRPAPTAAPVSDHNPHRRLTAEECGQLHDFMREKGWLAGADAPREAVVKGCVESPEATRAFYDCVLASETREESERCQ
jgi:hypothetical protein